MNTSLKKTLAISSVSLFLLGPAQAISATGEATQSQVDSQSVEISPAAKEKQEAFTQFESQQIKDAWIHGKVEAALTLNRHLNPFTIDTDVADGKVTLSGEVESDIDKQLAGEIAKSIGDVESVENNLAVKPYRNESADTAQVDGSWKQTVSDMTTTAIVKTKLLANSATSGLSIDVSTNQDVVVLEGKVVSSEEKELAELIAQNTDGVKDVENRLQVAGS